MRNLEINKMDIKKEKTIKYFENWKKVFRDPNITPTQKVILKDLELYRNTRTGYAWPSTEKMAEDLGMSRKTVERNIPILEEYGLIVSIRSRGKVNKYRLPRNLEYPLHEIEANTGHECLYFDRNDIVKEYKNEEVGHSEYKGGTFQTERRDIGVPRTISKELSLGREYERNPETHEHPADVVSTRPNDISSLEQDPAVKRGQEVTPHPEDEVSVDSKVLSPWENRYLLITSEERKRIDEEIPF